MDGGRHREERSDVAIQGPLGAYAPRIASLTLAMTANPSLQSDCALR